RRRELGVETVHRDEVRAHRAKDDGDVDAFAVHRLQHRQRIVAGQILGRIAIAAGGYVTDARLVLAHAGQAPPLGTVEERREDLAVEAPALEIGAFDGLEARRAIAERRLHVALPEIARLDHVDVAVHHLEAVLGHRPPPVARRWAP